MEHAALDAATQGFEDALTAQFGENVTFDFQNAQNDSATCATIANGFVSAGVDLIMANATPALQAAQAATNSIPILGTSVTEYGVALGLTDFDGTVGGNVSGTSDLAPLDQQADMITEWLPEATKEEGICSGCGVATLSISYYDLGYTTGEMAAKVLTGEADISTMPVEYTNVTKKYNKTICDDLGMTVPEGYEAIEE